MHPGAHAANDCARRRREQRTNRTTTFRRFLMAGPAPVVNRGGLTRNIVPQYRPELTFNPGATGSSDSIVALTSRICEPRSIVAI
jgi:hypothetical protein